MAHQRGLIVLPGYPVERALQVRYLDWTVPLVAFTIGLTGALGAGTLRDRLLWACSLPLLVWYLVSMQERTTQGIAAVITVIVLSIPRFGGLTVRRLAGLAAVSGLVVVLQGSFVPAPASITVPLHQMLMRWSQALTDGSLAVRLAELRSGMVRLTDDPLFGIGLGTIVSDTAPPGALGPWRYVSTGYGFLLIRTGIIGLSLFAGMTSTAIVSAIRRLHAAPDERAWPSVSIGLTGLGALLALNLNYPALDVPEGVIAFGLFYGMIASHRALRKERPGLPANGEPR